MYTFFTRPSEKNSLVVVDEKKSAHAEKKRREKSQSISVGTGGNKYLRTTYAAKVRNSLKRRMGCKDIVYIRLSVCECPM